MVEANITEVRGRMVINNNCQVPMGKIHMDKVDMDRR
jgi:hypothetical protein